MLMCMLRMERLLLSRSRFDYIDGKDAFSNVYDFTVA
jgi:hypothetical protein